MKYINVVGTSASGKSTFSKTLANALNLTYIELDNLFWLDDWKGSSDDLFFDKLLASLEAAPYGYVIDGNYTRTIPIKWAKTDTIVIWLDLPLYVNVYRSIKRALNRAIFKRKLWENSNNRESFLKLFSKDSIVWHMFKSYKANRAKYLALMQHPDYSYITWIRLTSLKEMEKFLAQYKH